MTKLEPDVCIHCGEPILSDELRALHGLVMHYECSIRSIAGSVAHQRGLCSCYGGTGEDDSSLTVRQNARLACQVWHQAQGYGWPPR